MAPLIPCATTTLSYPLYSCDFDPADSTRLVVGGGGGPNNGVGNKITLIDASKPTAIQQLAELELPKDEDNVTSLAVAQQNGGTTLVYAGVNSNPAGVKPGKNSHLRVLKLKMPKAGKEQSTGQAITEVSRTSLFTGTDKDIYQRITRLSNPFPGNAQLGAITNGLDRGTETILFNATTVPSSKPRAILTTEQETEDVDILQTGVNEFAVAYCTQYDVYIKYVSTTKVDEEPRCSYVTPFSKSKEKPTVPKFRALRWLTKDLILTLTNNYGNSGVVLQILRLPPSGQGDCHLLLPSTKLSGNIKKATGIAVANLTPPTAPTEEQGYTQFVIAVVGQDNSISLLTADLQVVHKVSLLPKITHFRTFKSVHPSVVTSVAFSHFTPPKEPITGSTPPQVLRLASVSAQQTVAIHTLPLFPVPLSVKRGQSKTPRYVVAVPSKSAERAVSLLVSILGAILLAIFAQAILDMRGSDVNLLNVKKYVPTGWHDTFGISSSTIPKLNIPNSAAQVSTLPEIIADVNNEDGQAVVVIKDTPRKDGKVKIRVHDEEAHGPPKGKPWGKLSAKQKAAWKKKLIEAGHWAEDLPETILKGVVFGELAGAVGHAVAG